MKQIHHFWEGAPEEREYSTTITTVIVISHQDSLGRVSESTDLI